MSGVPTSANPTLINRLVGRKVSIVTSRPQTTRNRILGIVNRPHAQVVLIDTPGIHRAETALGRQMMDEVKLALEGIDVLAVMIDAAEVDLDYGYPLCCRKSRGFLNFQGRLIGSLARSRRHRPVPVLARVLDDGLDIFPQQVAFLR